MRGHFKCLFVVVYLFVWKCKAYGEAVILSLLAHVACPCCHVGQLWIFLEVIDLAIL